MEKIDKDAIYLLTAEEDLKYHIMGDPVRDGFPLVSGQSIKILGSVIPHVKTSRVGKGKGRGRYKLEALHD